MIEIRPNIIADVYIQFLRSFNMTTILEVQNLKKYFPTAKGLLHAVDDVTFSVEKGTTIGVVGESGCGKTTLGRTIIHLLDSSGGKIIFDGNDITEVNISTS